MAWPGTGEPTTIKELAGYVGQSVLLGVDQLEVLVEIADVRTSYGNVNFLVAPLHGKGEQWVSAARCKGLEPPMRSL